MSSVAFPYEELKRRIDEFMERGYANHDLAHNIDHARQVYSNMELLLKRANARIAPEEEIELRCIGLGHDLRDHKLVHLGLCLSAEEIKAFYESILGPKAALDVIHIHENCSWSKRKESVPLEFGDWMRQLLQDADWLEAIGEAGLQRCIDYTHACMGDRPDLVCKHILEKLLLIPEELNFDVSKELVAERDLLKPLKEYLAAHGYNLGYLY